MKKFIKFFILMVFSTSIAVAQNQDNPLLQDWNTPHGTPPFSRIKNEHYLPATKAAIEQAQKNVQGIVNNKEKPTFDNTIVAIEQATLPVERVANILFNLNECNTNDEMQKVSMEVSPLLTQFSNALYMDEKLFSRVKVLYDQYINPSTAHGTSPLTIEQATLLDKVYQSFIDNGVGLSPENKAIFARNAEELATLELKFGQNVLADNNKYYLHITQNGQQWTATDGYCDIHSDLSMLAGLPDNVVAAAREEAQQRGWDGWVFTLDYPSYGPFLTFAENRTLRQQMWTAYNSRGNHGDDSDNNDIIRRITQLRMEQAQLLGYKNYCQYILSNRMAESPEKLDVFMKSLLDASLPAAHRDVAEVQDFAKIQLQSWDFSHYSEKLKQQKYDFDAELLRPYFQLEKVRQGIFDLYGTLYGLSFKEVTHIDTYHPDVHTYEVYDGQRFMGVLYLDMHPRASKRGGAWMTEFRQQSNINGKQIRPLIQVVCNFSKPVGDKPALLSFDEVETFMHEMGHAMHGMLSDCTYATISGTSVKRDFVELPSQVMENWCNESAFLNTFARHYLTGDTIPGEYIQKIQASEKYLAGYYSVRQLNFGLADIAFHSLDQSLTGSVESFENLHTVALLPLVKGCPFSTAFSHIFAGGYASGYYGYKWAEVLDADVFSKFKADGIFNKKTAMLFRQEILSKGGSQHPSILFRNFMGRDPSTDALMHRCGFIK